MHMNMEQEPGEGQAPLQVQRVSRGRESMETLVIIGVLVAYLVLMRWVFPHMSVPTCGSGECSDWPLVESRSETNDPSE
jgi:hypothetical protein